MALISGGSTEINLSVVHWIREYLGVQLPDYFNKHQELTNAVFHRTGRAIDFNLLRHGTDNEWKPPGLGESRYVYDKITENGADLPHWFQTTQQILLRNWTSIQTTRNEAAHTRLINEMYCHRKLGPPSKTRL